MSPSLIDGYSIRDTGGQFVSNLVGDRLLDFLFLELNKGSRRMKTLRPDRFLLWRKPARGYQSRHPTHGFYLTLSRQRLWI